MRALYILLAGVIAAAVILALRVCTPPRGETRQSETVFEAPRQTAGVRPLQIGDPIPDASLVNQDGRRIRLSDLRGQPLVVTFIFTRCRVSSMCPMATAKMKQVQTLARGRNIKARLLVVSFDPADSPEVLNGYATRHEVDLSNWDFLSGPAQVVGPLARAFNTYYRRDSDTYEHNIVVSLVDAEGRLRDDFFGTEWDPAELVSALEALAPSDTR